MAESPPVITAILTNYNHSQLLPNALEAILNQTVPFDEILIYDDCSTDNSVEVIEAAIAGHPQAVLIKNPRNLGIETTQNLALARARGEFIFFVAADDEYSKRIVELAKEAIRRFPDVGLVTGNSRTNDVDTGIQREFVLPFPQAIGAYDRSDMERLAAHRCVTFYGGANVMRKDAIANVGGYLPELKWHSDWLLYLLLALRYRFAVLPEFMVRIRITHKQYSYASFDWSKQKSVIETFIRVIKEKHPGEYGFFRDHGILPTYDPQALWLIITKPQLRHYLTPLLAWRLISYKPLRVMARSCKLTSNPLLRKLFRV